MLEAKDVILFQGDSITDAGRNRQDGLPNSPRGLGTGYPFLCAAALHRRRAADRLKIHNRGISGNRVPDLIARWDRDALDLEPDVLSILIGVNDIWHAKNGSSSGTVEDYGKELHELLDRTRGALPQVRLVMCEPFALRVGAVSDAWYPEFDERRAVAKEQSEVFAATWVPFQSVLDEAVTEAAPAERWLHDGVHPTLGGHALLAEAWLAAVEGN